VTRAEDIGSCWIWNRSKFSNGYARYKVKKIDYAMHRLAWKIANKKEIPKGMFICHKCDVRNCINPHHLFLGTISDNNKDMASKGRYWGQKITHCKNGHELSGSNVYNSPKRPKKRGCRICRKISNHSYRMRAGQRVAMIYFGS
jgi:hypothetical protein